MPSPPDALATSAAPAARTLSPQSLAEQLQRNLAAQYDDMSVAVRRELRWYLDANRAPTESSSPAAFSAFSQYSIELREFLLVIGHDGVASVDTWRDEEGWSALHHAVRLSAMEERAAGLVEELLPLLSTDTISVATRVGRPTGWTALHMAANGPGCCRQRILSSLLHAFADPNPREPRGGCALLLAARTMQLESCRVLVESGKFSLDTRYANGFGLLDVTRRNRDVHQYFVRELQMERARRARPRTPRRR